MQTFEEILQDRIQALSSGRADEESALARIEENERMLNMLKSEGINVVVSYKPDGQKKVSND